MSSSPIWRLLYCAVLLASCPTVSLAQNAESKPPPVFDLCTSAPSTETFPVSHRCVQIPRFHCVRS
jgi:hypothetical protein